MNIFEELRNKAVERFKCVYGGTKESPVVEVSCKSCSFCFIQCINEAEAKVKAAIEKLKENHEGERIVDCKGTTDKTSVTGESGCALPTYSLYTSPK